MKATLFLITTLLLLDGCHPPEIKIEKVVMVSANAEWKVVTEVFPNEVIQPSPWGEFFAKELAVGSSKETIIIFHGGWGKVAAAGSAQYCIDRWAPRYIINIGTCGGFEGEVKKYETILVNRTVIYDIAEAMGDSQQAINDYSTTIDLSWLDEPFPATVMKALLVSADRDLVPKEIESMKSTYHAVAGDWESGAIAYTCSRNKKRILILRGVTDLVSNKKWGEAYQNEHVFIQGTEIVMRKLLRDLPLWLEKCK